MPDAPSNDESLATLDANVVAQLRRLRSGDSEDLFTRLVGLFHTASADYAAQLQEALASQDFGFAAALCHKLKSSAGNVGALAFSQRTSLLEQLCIQGNAARAAQVLNELQAAWPSLLRALTAATTHG
ncbi:MAG TPA: Hpt domain-containing protein [Steroidobacteraceae bacterium]|jgi:HPt (histidine-containing phosphotransfer) domain-containing protein